MILKKKFLFKNCNFGLFFKPDNKMEQYQILCSFTNKAYSTRIIQEDQGIALLYRVWSPQIIL